jgi:2-succinyl-5-enolpyruvyl-6-hydroxy-3-cyclohexene-1-carboxylate synthase
LVVAGFGAGPAAAELAAAANWPLVAEPASGSWHGPQAVPAGRLAVELLGDRVERVVVFGRPVLSRPVTRLIQDPGVEAVIVHPGGGPWFDLGRRVGPVAGAVIPPGPDERGPRGRRGGPDEWLEAWLTAGWEAWRQIAALPFPNGPAVAAAVAAAAGLTGPAPPTASGPGAPSVCAEGRSGASSGWGGIVPGEVGGLVVGSSSAVRDLALVPPPVAPGGLVAAPRGVAGIDGTVSFAAGVAAARAPGATLALLGDLALAHDVGGLLTPALERQVDLRVVVLADGGGGIFETLEPARPGLEATFERFFATPVELDLAGLARAYGLAFAEAGDRDQLREALAAPARGISLVRVPLERAARRGMEARAVELSRNCLRLRSDFP